MTAKTGLVLQGGGALGAFEFGALKRLYEEADFAPDVISGVSIGAINAACLVGAKGDPIDTLGRVWDRFCVLSWPLVPEMAQRFLSLWGNASFYRVRSDYLGAAYWTSFYDTGPLRQVLREFIDFQRLNASPISLHVSATNIETGAVEVFHNHDAGITEDHIVASGSLPPGFPMTRIGEKVYWDGGLFNNTPLAPVIEELNPDPAVAKRLYVMDLFPNAGKVPRHMLDVLDRMFEMIFSNKLVFDVKTAHRIDEFVETLDAIEANLPPEIAPQITNLDGYKRLRRYKAVKDIVVIENSDPEDVFGPFDFSSATVHRRIEAGYRAAAARLTEAGSGPS